MDSPSPAYLAAWASQIGFLSAFLGGVAATFATIVLKADRQSRVAGWALGLAAVSATTFVVAAVATTTVASGSHADAPAVMAGSDGLVRARVIAALCFALGVYLLLGALGCTGWLRSRSLGWTTSLAAAAAAVLVTVAILSL